MILSTAQQQSFWRLWAQVCKSRNWIDRAEVERERKALLKLCGFASLKDVDRTDGFTKLKNQLLVMLGTSLQAGIEVGNPSLNKARNYRHVICNEILPCFGLYEANPERYMATVMEDKNRWWKIDRPARGMSLDDLDAAQMKQLMMTLNARLHAKRKAAGHTIHDMKIAAGIRCGCRDCGLSRGAASMTPAPSPVFAGSDDPDWNV